AQPVEGQRCGRAGSSTAGEPDWVSLPLNLFRRSSRLLLRLIVRGAVPSRNEPAICYGNAMPVRMRADRLLVEPGPFESRAQAQAAIAAGLVTANDLLVVRPSQVIAIDAALNAAPAHPWASRGGVKLAAALDHFGFDPAGLVCLDVGASTGGFTDVLL